MKYRAEIDGLRAVAVIPVILFHADIEFFSGGFVGVDVFFAISGYLITSIILEDIKKKNFSFANFYERRARRILPALYFVILVSIPFAWFLIYPYQMIDFSNSLIAVLLFVSNILFWQETGYFESASDEKPLLHTWSLAVEEQFYLVFPIFLILIFKFSKNRAFWIIIITASISLILSEWGWRNTPSANFYLTPTRIWEILVGSISAFIVQKIGVQKNNLFSIIGFFLIISSIFIFNDQTPFPSLYTLFPVLGSVLLVIYANKDTLVGHLLSNKILVGIGLISYSAYLLHQPIFAFVKIKMINEPSPHLMIFLSFVSIIIAKLSWKFIEKPFRDKNIIQTRSFIIFLALGFFIILSVGLIGNLSDGLKFRYTGDAKILIDSVKSNPLRSKCHLGQQISELNKQPCEYFEGDVKIAVFGNSHGAELAYALASILKKDKISVQHNTMTGCYHNYMKYDERESVCYLWHEKVVNQLINDKEIEHVIISYRNEKYLGNNSYRESLVKMINEILLSNKNIILVLQATLAEAGIEKYITEALKSKKNNIFGLTKLRWNEIYNSKNELLDELPNKVHVVDPADILCDEVNCFTVSNGKAMYFDNDHMSIEAATLVANFLIKSHIFKD